MAWAIGNRELGLKEQTQNQSNALGWGDLAVRKYGADLGLVIDTNRNTAAADRQSSSDTSTFLGTMLGAGLSAGLKTDPTTGESFFSSFF